MKQQTVKIKPGLRSTTLVLILAMIAVVLGGCSTYYQSHYPDSGVYYGDSGVYGHSSGYSRGEYAPGYGFVNPAAYPYWSIDYFYFSRYYHPYSVFVGYNEPLYYPYPGWAFGHYRPARVYGSLAFGFGYPWHGFGYRYPAYTFGFFSGYDPFYYGGYYGHRHRRGDDHRIRQIDRRLESLQYGNSPASRRDLLGRERLARSAGSAPYDSRGSNRSDTRPQSRDALLRQRNADNSPALRGRTFAPDRTIQRRASDVRSDRQSERRVLDRNRIRRAPNTDGSRSERSTRDSSRQIRERSSKRADAAVRGSLLNRSSRSADAPSRSIRKAPAPRRPARNTSRTEPPSRASAPTPSRRTILRDRSANGGRSTGGRSHRRR